MGGVPDGFSLLPYPQGYNGHQEERILNLTQRNHDVMTYVNAFNTLSQYASKEVATDAKK